MNSLPSMMHESWQPFLQSVFDNDYSLSLLQKNILPNCVHYPQKKNIFNVFSMPIYDIKVVILGQDPYPQEGQAIGYAFAISDDTRKPVSFRNIEKEVGHELPNTLHTWVQQGVFLLNTALTVHAAKAGSHIEYWKPFTQKVVQAISNQGVIWLLWGQKAQEYEKIILTTNHDGNFILKAPHPAAEAYTGGKAGFFGCNHFNEANEILVKQTKQIINW